MRKYQKFSKFAQMTIRMQVNTSIWLLESVSVCLRSGPQKFADTYISLSIPLPYPKVINFSLGWYSEGSSRTEGPTKAHKSNGDGDHPPTSSLRQQSSSLCPQLPAASDGGTADRCMRSAKSFRSGFGNNFVPAYQITITLVGTF